MATRRQNRWSPRATTASVPAICVAAALAWPSSFSLAQHPSPQKPILLMYGDGRVELYPPPDPSGGQLLGPPAPLPANPNPAERRAANDPYPPARQHENSDENVATETSEATDGGDLTSDTPREPPPPLPEEANPWRTGHPLRPEAVQLDPFSLVPSREASGLRPLCVPNMIGAPEGPGRGEASSTLAAAASGDVGNRLEPPTPLPAPMPDHARSSGGAAEKNAEDAGRSDSAMSWPTTGMVQVLGTLVGLSIGLPVGAVAVIIVLRRFGGERLAPVIRVQIANPPFSTGAVLQPSEVAAQAGECSAPVPDTPVPVVDLRDHPIPLQSLDKTYDQEQRTKAEQRKHQEREILKQIMEENVAFREGISRLAPAA